MLTSPVAQLVSRWTSDLKVGGSRPVQNTSKINPIFACFRWLSSWHMRCWLHAAITRTPPSPSEILPSSFKTWLPRFNAKPKINWMQNYDNLWIIKQTTPTLMINMQTWNKRYHSIGFSDAMSKQIAVKKMKLRVNVQSIQKCKFCS